MSIDDFIYEEDGGDLYTVDGYPVRGISINAQILKSLNDAFNKVCEITQGVPVLEIYQRDGKLYICEQDFPREPQYETEVVPDNMGVPISGMLTDADPYIRRAVDRIVRLAHSEGGLDYLSWDPEHPDPDCTLQVYNSNGKLAVTVDGQLVYGEFDPVLTGVVVETVVAKRSTIRHSLAPYLNID